MYQVSLSCQKLVQIERKQTNKKDVGTQKEKKHYCYHLRLENRKGWYMVKITVGMLMTHESPLSRTMGH